MYPTLLFKCSGSEVDDCDWTQSLALILSFPHCQYQHPLLVPSLPFRSHIRNVVDVGALTGVVANIRYRCT
jgi:hypothetical protein